MLRRTKISIAKRIIGGFATAKSTGLAVPRIPIALQQKLCLNVATLEQSFAEAVTIGILCRQCRAKRLTISGKHRDALGGTTTLTDEGTPNRACFAASGASSAADHPILLLRCNKISRSGVDRAAALQPWAAFVTYHNTISRKIV
ncbi:hypothetical protein, partial [Sphingomonas sp. 28-63-12]|uniref:hypothetical protein n=1 Tax=Sphingomonas sp. 28-63-12 TaxID=1970434 RepID=UPI0035A939E0